MLKVKTLDEAVSWATRLAEALGATEIDVGPVTEAWDIGMGSKPDGEVPLRVLALPKADAQYEAGVPLSAEREAKLRQLLAEMKSAGVLLANEKLKPSSCASRLTVPVGGKRKLIDGPFAESKELVAGFTTVRVSSKDEAVAWARRYGDILDVNEIDIREVVEE
jgi:hypothetical protein